MFRGEKEFNRDGEICGIMAVFQGLSYLLWPCWLGWMVGRTVEGGIGNNAMQGLDWAFEVSTTVLRGLAIINLWDL